MAINVYRMTCMTNLHMGSGEVNYNIIDLEVEKDPILGEPTMNASGIKGALRDACEQKFGKEDTRVTKAFGKPDAGTYKFFQGDMLARPVRVSDGDAAYTLATTPELVNCFMDKLSAFGVDWLNGIDALPKLKNAERIICGRDYKEVEGVQAEQGKSRLLETILGTDNWALMGQKMLADIDLPVQAHNVLDDSGTSNNLWFEQNVPHKSVFYMMIAYPDGEQCLIDELLKDNKIVQFGAGATTGNGYMELKCVFPKGGKKA